MHDQTNAVAIRLVEFQDDNSPSPSTSLGEESGRHLHPQPGLERRLSRHKPSFADQILSFRRRSTTHTLANNPNHPDALDENLAYEIEDDFTAEQFLHDYAGFKDKKHISHVLHSIVWYRTFVRPVRPETGEESFQPDRFPKDDPQSKKRKNAAAQVDRASKRWSNLKKVAVQTTMSRSGKDITTYGTILQQLSNMIEEAPPNCHQLCTIVAGTRLSHEAFSFRQKLQASIGSRLHTLYDAPKLSIVTLLSYRWGFLPETIDKMMAQRIKDDLPISAEEVLPSKRKSRIPIDPFAPRAMLASCMTLSWYAKTPEYRGDFDNYIWQDFASKPRYEWLKVFLAGDPTSKKQVERTVVVFKTMHEMKRFKELREEIEDIPQDEEARLRDMAVWEPRLEMITTLLAIFQLIVEDTEKFSEGMKKQIKNLTYDGRKTPSVGKVQFLLHLNDSREDAIARLEASARLLRDIKSSLHTTTCPLASLNTERCLSRIADLETDIQFLHSDMSASGATIDELRKMCNDQLHLSSIQRQSVLAILAALYLPLAYASSIFGMNISSDSLGYPNANLTTLFDGIVSNTSTSNSASVGTLDFTRLTLNETKLLVEAVTDGGNHNWDFKWYWVVVVPLAFGSIVFPLIAGGILRFIMQSLHKYHLYWRAMGIVFVAFYMIGVYGVLWTYVDGIFLWGYTGDFWRTGVAPDVWGGTQPYVAYCFYNALTMGVYLSVALWNLYSSFKAQSMRLLWSIFFLVCVTSCVCGVLYSIDYSIQFGSYYQEYWTSYTDLEGKLQNVLVSYTGPLIMIDLIGMVPWMFLLVVWIWPSVARWVQERRKAKTRIGRRRTTGSSERTDT